MRHRAPTSQADRSWPVALGTVALVVGLVVGTDRRDRHGSPGGHVREAATLSLESDDRSPLPTRCGPAPLVVGSLRRDQQAGQRVNAPRRTTGGAGAQSGVSFGGGSVVTGSPKVFLVFWGSGWGSPSTGLGGYEDYSGDPDGLAPNLQAFFAGLGTNNESWSAIVTQYCQGVPVGTKTCPPAPSTNHVAYPSSTVLGGVWEDTVQRPWPPPPRNRSPKKQFSAAFTSRNPPGAQYVIVSPTGTDPDQWLSPRNGYCAYHDSTGDPSSG